MTPTYRALADAIGRQLGQRAELVDGTSLDQLRDGLVDAAFLCGLPYVRLQSESPGSLSLIAAPVLVGEPSERPVYYSDVVVKYGSPFRDFRDLRGTRWAHTEAGSFSGYLATRHHLALMGESERFFGEVLYAGSHRRAIAMVLAGQADAAAIDSHVTSVERQHADLDGLRVIARFGPAPIPAVVATRRLPDELRAKVRTILCQMDTDTQGSAILRAGMIRRFVPVTDSHYDDIRRKLDVVERSGAAV